MAILDYNRLQEAARVPKRALAREMFPSLPIPAGLTPPAVAFFYYLGSYLGADTVEVYAPEYVALLSPRDGHLLRMYGITPAEFGQPEVEGSLGNWQINPAESPPEDAQAEWERLRTTYDTVLPVYFEQRSISSALRLQIQAFRTLFTRLSEPPLQPYYRQIGRSFFDWLDRHSR